MSRRGLCHLTFYINSGYGALFLQLYEKIRFLIFE